MTTLQQHHFNCTNCGARLSAREQAELERRIRELEAFEVALMGDEDTLDDFDPGELEEAVRRCIREQADSFPVPSILPCFDRCTLQGALDWVFWGELSYVYSLVEAYTSGTIAGWPQSRVMAYSWCLVALDVFPDDF